MDEDAAVRRLRNGGLVRGRSASCRTAGLHLDCTRARHSWGAGSIDSLRITDKRAKGDTPFRLFGTGSVGSHVLTGIPRLASIRFDPQFARCSAVWPFETEWAAATGSWLDPELWIVHAEIYPSVRAPLPDTIKDRGQVRSMWHWARDLDQKNYS